MKTEVWYSVIPYPADFEWHGARHACGVLDAMANEAPVFSSRDKRAALAESRRRLNRGQLSEIFETDWNPKLQIEWVYKPDA